MSNLDAFLKAATPRVAKVEGEGCDHVAALGIDVYVRSFTGAQREMMFRMGQKNDAPSDSQLCLWVMCDENGVLLAKTADEKTVALFGDLAGEVLHEIAQFALRFSGMAKPKSERDDPAKN